MLCSVILTGFLCLIDNLLPYQAEGYEQIAFEYFCEQVLPKEYTRISKLEFGGLTEVERSSLHHLKICFSEAEQLGQKLDSAASLKGLPKKQIDYRQVKNIHFKHIHKDSKQAKVYVMQTTIVEGRHYVVIQLYKPYHFVDYFLFEFNNNGQIIRYCKTGEII